MMKNKLSYILALFGLLVLSACNDKTNDPQDIAQGEGLIYVAAEPAMIAEAIGEDDTDDTAPIINNAFAPGNLLYFSQMPQGQSPNFSDDSEEAYPYMYIYEYYSNDAATWSQGFNFKNKKGRLSFDWENVLAVGPSGNAFKFFGFFFPIGNTPVWEVEQDQTGSNDPYDTSNFLKSDIMGAYHSTSSIYTRMRFRLFHLMTYLKVTLYVPVFQTETNAGGETSYSGFDKGAMRGAFVMNAIRDFIIEWSASKSSDTEAPFVKVNENSPNRSNIKMYAHRADEDDITTIDVKNYYGGPVDGITDDEDQVRTYNFSVLFPTQNWDGNFLCFSLTTPGGDNKYYYFSGTQILGEQEGSFGLTPGTLQQLYLYLPRKTNQTILVGAKILPWKDATTDMTVIKQQNSGEDDED